MSLTLIAIKQLRFIWIDGKASTDSVLVVGVSHAGWTHLELSVRCIQKALGVFSLLLNLKLLRMR
jgi:hypothetical protein